MSEIKKCRLDLDGIDHFDELTPLHFKGLRLEKEFQKMASQQTER